METNNIQELIRKYYSGEASLQETEILKKHFSEGEGKTQQSEDAVLFRMLAAASEVPEDLVPAIEKAAERHFNAPARRWRTFSLTAAAVTVAAAIVAAFFIPSKEVALPQDTFDDPVIAQAEVVKALEMLGKNLNYCMDYTIENTEKARNKATKTMEKVITDIND